MVPSLLPLALLLLVTPAHPFRAAGASSLLWTHGSSFGGGGILTSDNHNSLYTRATVSSPSPCPLRCSSCFALLVLVWTRRPLFLSLLVFSHHFFAMSFPPPWSPDHPVASTTAIPQLFSTFLALVAVAACRRISRAFRYHVLYWSFFSFSLSLFRFLSFVFFIVHLFLLLAVWHPSLASISRVVAPSSHLPHFLSFSKWASEFMRRN